MCRVGSRVEDDFYRYALDDFDKIAGGIFRRQKTEDRTGSGLQTIHAAFEFHPRISVDLDINRLPYPHFIYLGFLEIRDDPDSA